MMLGIIRRMFRSHAFS